MIDGFALTPFEDLRDIFERNFERGLETGASFCAITAGGYGTACKGVRHRRVADDRPVGTCASRGALGPHSSTRLSLARGRDPAKNQQLT